MRDVAPEDIEWIDDVVDDWPASLRWDVKGWTPSRPALMAKLWEGVVVQQVALGRDGQPTGLVQLVEVDVVNGRGRVEVVAQDVAVVAPVARAFVHRAMQAHRLGAVHVHAGADALDVPTLLPEAREVGRLPGHLYRGRGRHEDVAIYAVRVDGGEER